MLGMLGGAFVLTAVLAAVLGIPPLILREIEKAFPERRVMLRAKAVDLGMLRMESGIEGPAIDALRVIPGVVAVHPIEPLRVPASLSGSILDFTLQTDAIVWGVPPEILTLSVGDMKGFKNVAWKEKAKLPLIVPSFYLDMYNSGMAAANGLPKISPSSAVGRKVELLLGVSTSMVGRQTKALTVPGEVIGMTPEAHLLGVLLPIETVREMNQWYQGSGYKPALLAAVVELKSLSDFDAVAKRAEELGLVVEGNREVVSMVRFLTLGGAALLLSLGLLVGGLAVLNAISTFGLLLHLRRDETCLMLAVGGTSGGIIGLFLCEVLAVSVMGALPGALLAWASCALGQAIALDVLPELSFVSGRVLWLSPLLPLLATFLLAIAAGVGALPMVWRQATLPPSRLLEALSAV